MRSIKKKISILLAVALLCCSSPVNVLADELVEQPKIESVTEKTETLEDTEESQKIVIEEENPNDSAKSDEKVFETEETFVEIVEDGKIESETESETTEETETTQNLLGQVLNLGDTASESVAQIGSITYPSLDAAIASVSDSKETTITMLKDVTYATNSNVTISAEKIIVLDLNGHTLTGVNNNTSEWAFLTNNGNLTISDFSVGKTGKITASTTVETNGYTGHYTVLNKGTMKLESGTIEETSEIVGGGANLKWALRNEASANQRVSLEITGGKVIGNYNVISNYVYDDTSECNLKISGGYFESTGRFSVLTMQIANATKPKMNVEISGGEFVTKNEKNTNGDGNATIYCDDQQKKVTDCSDLKISISGGKFDTFNTAMVVQFNEFKGETIKPSGYLTGGLYHIEPNEKEIAYGYECVANDDDNTKTNYPFKVVDARTVINENKKQSYLTLQEAIASASDGDTIQLTGDLSGPGVEITGSKFGKHGLTIDFGKWTYTCVGELVGSAGTKNQVFHFEADNKVTLKYGKVIASASDAKFLIQNYGDLTVEGMQLEITKGKDQPYGISCNSGKVVIKDYDNTPGGRTNIKVSEGGTALDCSWWPSYYPNGTQVTVNTEGTFEGNISLGIYGNGSSVATPCKSKLNIENVKLAGSFVKDSNSNGTYGTGLSKEQTARMFAEMCTIEGGLFKEIPSLEYIKDGKSIQASGDKSFPYTVGEKQDPAPTDPTNYTEVVVEQHTETSISKAITVEDEKTAVEEAVKKTEVTGVKDVLTEDGKIKILEVAKASFSDASLSNAELIDISITVKADVIAASTTNAVAADQKVLAYELTPYAVVTVVATNGDAEKSGEIIVDNDYLDAVGTKKITVVLGCNFEPEEVLHIKKDETVERFASGTNASYDNRTFVYNKTAKTVTLEITEFSRIKLLGKASYANISFDANGGSGSMDTVSILKDTSYTLPSNEFTAPDGKVFDCWRIIDDRKNAGESISVSGDITVHAQWKEKESPYSYSSGISSKLFTGTTGNPVTNGKWNYNVATNTWTYTTSRMFTNTWGYIYNPYAAVGQHTSDWFYFDSTGKMVTGWQKLYWKGILNWYYFKPVSDGTGTYGACQLGGITPDGYTLNPDGSWAGF